MTMHPPVTEYVRALEIVRDVVQLPLRPGVADTLPPVMQLRKRRYDRCILPFPATRWQYAAIARGVASKQLCMHDYRGLANLIARSGGHLLVPLRGGHRIAENFRLALAMGLSRSDDDLRYWVPESWRARRIAGTLGVHPGSMAWK